MKNINIQISDTLHKELKLIATKEEKTLKSLVINALEEYVDDKREKEYDKAKKGIDASHRSKEKPL